ncbi:hypothetical protein NFI96_029413 [Prochilodus magdalenae]|nr:hypothetical protein NFI96_029413 [Prochilodus magdalenae]
MCLTTEEYNLDNKKPAGFLQTTEVEEAGHILGLDFMGPFPRGKKGNNYLLVVVDYYTKLMEWDPTEMQIQEGPIIHKKRRSSEHTSSASGVFKGSVTGGRNHTHLPAFFQCVDCPTRKNRTINLLYANVRDAYRATPLPPLGKSDHNLVFLQPQYKPLVLRQPTTTRSFRVWSPEAEEALKDCYDTTDWNVLLHPHRAHGEDIEGVTHCVTDYLNFCMDVAVPTKTVRCLPNNKSWITSDVKDILNQKKRAFRDGNWTEAEACTGGTQDPT